MHARPATGLFDEIDLTLGPVLQRTGLLPGTLHPLASREADRALLPASLTFTNAADLACDDDHSRVGLRVGPQIPPLDTSPDSPIYSPGEVSEPRV